MLDPDRSPGFLLWHATLRWQRGVADALRPLDLTHVQFVLLACAWWLGERGTCPNQLALARRAGIDVKMTSQVLRTLERKGLLVREPDPADSRAKLVRVTAAGADVAPRAIAVVEAVDADFFAGVDIPTATTLLTWLAHGVDPSGSRPEGAGDAKSRV